MQKVASAKKGARGTKPEEEPVELAFGVEILERNHRKRVAPGGLSDTGNFLSVHLQPDPEALNQIYSNSGEIPGNGADSASQIS